MNTEHKHTTERRVVPYMQTDSYPTRIAIESQCPFSGEFHLTGIYDTEKFARNEVKRRENAAMKRVMGGQA